MFYNYYCYKKKKVALRTFLTIQRYFLTQEKKNDCRRAEKNVMFFIPNFKSNVPKKQRHYKSMLRKRLHPSSPLKLPCPEDKSLLIRMKRSHEGEGKGLNAHVRRSGMWPTFPDVWLQETEGGEECSVLDLPLQFAIEASGQKWWCGSLYTTMTSSQQLDMLGVT